MARQTRRLTQLPLRTKLEWLASLIVILGALSVTTLGHTTQAVLTYDNGQITYTGQVKNHQMNGQGKLTYANGDVYDGQFSDGAFNGEGTFTSSQGWSYTGAFKNGQPHGQGKLTTKDNRVYEGQFKQGIYQK